MKLTGERPMEGATPDSLLALHDAGYREVIARLGPGVVVDVGCGIGSETDRLAGPDRLVIGADYSSDTVAGSRTRTSRTAGARVRRERRRRARPARPQRRLRVSSHIIEHFVNPALHVIELARVLRADGTAFVITPNAPADFENPFHVYLFEPEHLVSLLSLFFDEVTCLRPRGRRGAEGRLRDAARERRAAAPSSTRSTCAASSRTGPTCGPTSTSSRSPTGSSSATAPASAPASTRRISSSSDDVQRRYAGALRRRPPAPGTKTHDRQNRSRRMAEPV